MTRYKVSDVFVVLRCVERTLGTLRPPRPLLDFLIRAGVQCDTNIAARYGSVLVFPQSFVVIHSQLFPWWKTEREKAFFCIRWVGSWLLWKFAHTVGDIAPVKTLLVWLRAQVSAIHIMIKYPYILRSGSLAACLFIFLSTLPSDISTIPLEAAFQGKCVRCLPGAVPISIQKLLHHTNWYFCHDRRHAMASIIHSNRRLPTAIYSFLHLKVFPTPAHYDILLL